MVTELRKRGKQIKNKKVDDSDEASEIIDHSEESHSEEIMREREPRPHWPALRESTLTKIEGPSQSYANFALLLLLIWIALSVTEEMYESGRPVDWTLLMYNLSDFYLPLLANTFFGAVSCVIFVIVKLISMDILAYNALTYTVYSFVVLFLIMGPWFLLVYYFTNATPLAGLGISMQCAVIVMKNHSYFFTMRGFFEQCKGVGKFDRDTDIVLPKGAKFTDLVTIRSYMGFLFNPSLCYYTKFPACGRSRSQRAIRALRFAVEAAVAFFFAYVILNRYLVNTWREHLLKRPVYTLLSTCVPGGTFWMLMFYGIFHALLNFWSEVVDYGDRRFYGAWWETDNFDDWWREWNITVTNWFRRHVYFQSMQDAHFPQTLALIVVMATSAIWHEYVLYMAFRVRRPWLSTTMMVQIGLIFITRIKMFSRTALGNFLIWFSFYFGYPLVLMAYAFQWCLQSEEGTCVA